MTKSIHLQWLSKTNLSNLNAGEGAGNLTELKLYDSGRKPYVSGQSVRRALLDTVARSYKESFLCTPERPCTDVEQCWGCDLRGFLAPEEGVGGTRRWSPIKASPGLGQIPSEIVTDLLTRHSDVEKEGRESKDMRLAHVQMMENIYKINVIIDVAHVGLVEEPVFEGKGKKSTFAGWQEVTRINNEEKRERIHALLDAIYHLSGFAKQARAVASLAPEVLLIALKDTYNQRGQQALDMEADGSINVERLKVLLKEHKLLGDELCVGWTPGIIANEDEVQDVLTEANVPVMSPLEAIQWAKDQAHI